MADDIKSSPENIVPEGRDGAIASDKATLIDSLHFHPYVQTLTDIIADGETETPLTLGIFGAWGSGKTSLMKMIGQALFKRKLARHFPVVWFDAWKYDREDALWRALVLRVLGEVRRLSELQESDEKEKEEKLQLFDDLEESLYRVVEREELGEVRIEPEKMIKGAGKMLLHLGLHMIPAIGHHLPSLLEKGDEELASGDVGLLFDAVRRERQKIYRNHVQHLEQFQQKFGELIQKSLPDGYRLIVFIDDLDRCLPEKAIQVLEAIKLFLDVEGCVFVLGLDHQVVRRAIEMKYRERQQGDEAGTEQKYVIQGIRYLEKIIQLPFHIPPIEKKQMGVYVKNLLKDWPDVACADVFAMGMQASPRQIKRTVNSFLLLWKLAGYSNPDQIKSVRLAKVVAIQQTAQSLYEILRETPRLLKELEIYYRQTKGLDERRVDHPGNELSEQSEVPLSPILRPYRDHKVLRQVLTMHEVEKQAYNFEHLTPDEIRTYFTLTRRTETAEQLVSSVAEVPRGAFDAETVHVPAGPFNIGSTREQIEALVKEGIKQNWVEREYPQHTIEMSGYAIGKYPVTNVEYQYFVKEAGHQSPKHWNGDIYPEDKGDHPVVEVSWDDAMAYCAWLSKKTGNQYTLPSEAQWEKAARGTDGRIYPWGNEWDTGLLNSGEGKRNDTSPVGEYSPRGDSPYGCADMAGNVWEWCLDGFDKKAYKNRKSNEKDPVISPGPMSERVLRGGAFSRDRQYVRCAFRSSHSPYARSRYVGFRIILLPSPSSGPTPESGSGQAP